MLFETKFTKKWFSVFMTLKKDVVIIGAELAGLSLANGLEKIGVSYAIVEQKPAASASGAGILIHPSGAVALETLGVPFPGNDREWCGLTEMRFGSPRNDSIVKVPIGEVGRPVISVHRRKLHEILLTNLHTETVFFGCHVDSFASASPVRHHISLNDGTEIDTALIVVASGANTALRTDLDQPKLINQSSQMVWRWTVDASLPSQTGYELHDGQWRLGVFPLSEKQCYIFLAANRMSLNEAKQIPPSEIMARVGRFGPIGEQTANANFTGTNVLLHAIFQGPVKWEGNNEEILIGDSAHPMLPNLGMGGSLAFEDSATLVSAIRCTGLDRDAIVQRLTQRTRRVKALARQSSMYGALAHLPGNLLTDLKLHSLRLAPSFFIRSSQRRLYSEFYKAMERS
ncbi:NAD(P)/FAD-dependent oxidoreductase [Marinimicrobium locisalis]|uniref:NAD(P)/FAD-dependent oxidoreductase n=1 Tax=Marinimicrobium locisalis TaxID=546022 RepID=UPI0032218CA3